MKKAKRWLLRGLAAVIAFTFLALVVANLAVYIRGRGPVDDPRAIKPRTAAIVLGARVYDDKSLSPMLADRVETAIDLYRDGKVKKLLLTGDHGRAAYDEVNAMKAYAIAAGVPETDIFTDHAGFSTYESIYRARDVFKVRRAVLVTQLFHLRRALFIARSLGLEAEGLVADRRSYVGATSSVLREYLANLKAFWEVTTGAKPTWLGPAIPITGDGRASRG